MNNNGGVSGHWVDPMSQNGGDSIAGKYLNPATGDFVFARQLINDGNGAMVMTDKGMIPMQNFMNYVKMDEDQSSVTNTSIANQPLPQQSTETSSLMSEDDAKLLQQLNNPKPKPKDNFLDKPLPQKTKEEKTNKKSTVEIEVESPNYKIIDKLFKKFTDSKPDIKLNIKWNTFPKDQLNNLIDFFDVPKDEIAEYMIKNLLNNENLIEALKKEF